jgi:hypothetical protein
MTPIPSTTSPVVRVAIDIAKLTHQVLLELPSGKRRVLRVANTKPEMDRLVAVLRASGHPCEIAFEATGDYHRPLAWTATRLARRPPRGGPAWPCAPSATRWSRRSCAPAPPTEPFGCRAGIDARAARSWSPRLSHPLGRVDR